VFEQYEMPWVDVNAKDTTEAQKDELQSSCEEKLLGDLAAVPDVEAGRGCTRGGGVRRGTALHARAAVPHAGILDAALTQWQGLSLATVASLVVVCVCNQQHPTMITKIHLCTRTRH
jgi:hypothetical protein